MTTPTPSPSEAMRLAEEHQAWFQYDEHCAERVRTAFGIKE